MHQQIKVGHILTAKAAAGEFTFDAQLTRPAVMIAAGIVMTPMMSMIRHALIERVKTRKMRSITLLSAAKNQAQRAFFSEVNHLISQSDGHINAYWALSEPDNMSKAGKDLHQTGRISKALIQAVLALDDYDFYLCGPASFMQNMYDMLLQLGVVDQRIHAEAFGPATLQRHVKLIDRDVKVDLIADQAVIEFSNVGVEQAWHKGDGNLLEFSESHGFTPEFSCRSGQCGACKTTLISGKVTYLTQPTAQVVDDEILLCCAIPAKTANDLPTIKLKL
jgi:ferredoxin-NADP reductase